MTTDNETLVSIVVALEGISETGNGLIDVLCDIRSALRAPSRGDHETGLVAFLDERLPSCSDLEAIKNSIDFLSLGIDKITKAIQLAG